jgi:hypothetical protein
MVELLDSGHYRSLMPHLTVRPGHPDFLDLPWDVPVEEWESPRLVDLPHGISRHVVRFVSYRQGIYVVKQLPEAAALCDHEALRTLEDLQAPAVTAVGLVQGRDPDRTAESAAALITRYLDYSFSYRELLQGPGFGSRRVQLLDAFASLLVQLHLAGCFWGDCSLSNTLYRWDADGIETRMVDAETASMHDALSDGQRETDLDIMIENVAGGMADIAAERGVSIDEADLELGSDIAGRYEALWNELSAVWVVDSKEQYKIAERIARVNDLGFNVEDLTVASTEGKLALHVRVGGRAFHANKLKELTGLDAGERQASQILDDLYYYTAKYAHDTPAPVAAIRWRVDSFEPIMQRLREIEAVDDQVQAYCDLLHHRYLMSLEAQTDIGTEAAFEDWVEAEMPGYEPVTDR